MWGRAVTAARAISGATDKFLQRERFASINRGEFDRARTLVGEVIAIDPTNAMAKELRERLR